METRSLCLAHELSFIALELIHVLSNDGRSEQEPHMDKPHLKLAEDIGGLAKAAIQRGVPVDEVVFVLLQAVIAFALTGSPPRDVGRFLSEVGQQVAEGKFPSGLSPKH